VIPKPVSTARYHHRSLNPKKLVEIQFSALGRNQVEPKYNSQVYLNKFLDNEPAYQTYEIAWANLAPRPSKNGEKRLRESKGSPRRISSSKALFSKFEIIFSTLEIRYDSYLLGRRI